MTEIPETNDAIERPTADPADQDLTAKELPEHWEEKYGLLVRDSDGWRGQDGRPWTDPITLPEFSERFNRSTVAGMTEDRYERFNADVKAARALLEQQGAAAPAPEPQPETNAQLLKRAATTLRMRGWYGDDFTADMLERCEPLANHAREAHVRSFVPLLDSALRLARTILDDEPDQQPLMTPSGTKLIRMAVTGELLGQILHLPPDIRVHGADYYAQLDRLDFLVHCPDAPPEAIRMSPVFERATGWPDPIHLCDIRWGFPQGVTPAAEPEQADAVDAEATRAAREDAR